MAGTRQPTTDAGGLQLLLFGNAGSGKTALLGALVQAGDSPSGSLHGKLVGDMNELHALRDRVYAGSTLTATTSLARLPIRFEPQTGTPIQATLLDCAGREAQPYLAGERPLEPRASGLMQALFDADTVIVTLDAGTTGQAPVQVATLRRFLDALTAARGARAEVAGLPVYLVLTKCDQLAKPGDTFLHWLQRIEDAKRLLSERVAQLLTAQTAGSFGSLDVHVWATAMRRPSLADRAESAEPFGVAELFRQCLPSAATFDEREQRASRLLELAVGSLAVVLVVLVLSAALFALSQPDTELRRLEERVTIALPDPEASAAKARLRGDLPERLRELVQIEQDAAFAKLPAKTRADVEATKAELASYLQTRSAFRTQVKHPYQAKNEAEFDRYERQARDFAFPAAYATAWSDTTLAVQRDRVRAEYASVRTALAEELRWLAQQCADGKQLDAAGNRLPAELTAPDPTKRQQGRTAAQAWIAAYLRYLDRPLFRLHSDQPLAGTVSFTYADLRKFAAVRTARSQWERIRNDLGETHKYISMRLGQ